MSEWWTYTLSDFLMFSPRIYWRMVEAYNRAFWPAQMLALAAGGAALWLARARQPWAPRALAALLAAAWLWVAWAFFWQRYSGINTAAPYLAGAWCLQAVALLALAALHGKPWNAQSWGWWAAGTVLIAYPLAAPLLGRPWTQAETVGWMPEPTALFSLCLLLAHRALPLAARCALAIVPVLSLLVGGATLWAMAAQ